MLMEDFSEKMIVFNTLWTSPVFWAIAVAVSAAQLIKIFLLVFKQKQKFVWQDLFITGNMPSAHAAIVTALSTILLLIEGFTPLFFASFVFATIVLRDAVGVRRAVGEESKVLTNVLIALKQKLHIAIPRRIHESLGHQPIEVFVGVLIGIVSSVVVYGLHLY